MPMTERKRIFLTGATGHLGGLLARQLVADGYRVVATYRDPARRALLDRVDREIQWISSDPGLMLNALRAEAFAACIHAATNYGRTGTRPSDLIASNVVFPLQLLLMAIAAGVPAFINCDTSLPPMVSEYALTKRHFRDHLRFHRDALTILNLRIQHFYGPQAGASNFVWHVARSLVRNVPRLALTWGTQERDFVHIDDVVRGVLTALNHLPGYAKGFHNLGIGSGEAISIRTLVETLAGLTANTATHLEWGAVPLRPGEPKRRVANLEAMRSLGWSPQVPLEQGLRAMVTYMQEHRE